VTPDIFMSDSEESLPEVNQTKPKKQAIKPLKTITTRESPANLFELLDNNSNPETSESEVEGETIVNVNHSKKKRFKSTEDKVSDVRESITPVNDVLSKAERKKIKKERRKAEEKKVKLKEITKLEERASDELHNHHYEEAVKLYNEAIKLCSSNNPMPSLFRDRADALMMLKNYKAALSDIRKVLTLESGDLMALRMEYSCCLSLGSVPECRECVAKLAAALGTDREGEREVKRMQRQVESLHSLEQEARQALEADKLSLASQALDSALAVSNYSHSLITLRATVLATQKRISEARALLRSLDTKDSSVKTSSWHYAQGLCAYYENDLERAISGFAEAKGFVQAAVAWHDRTHTIHTAFLASNRVLKWAGGNFDSALTTLEAGLRADPSNSSQMGRLYFNRALIYEKLGKIELAIEDCGNVIRQDADHHKAFQKRGCLQQGRGNHEAAVSDLEAALRLKPCPEYRRMLEEAGRRKKRALLDSRVTHYSVLGVDRAASPELIKKAYRAKAREFHPDKHARAEPEEKEKMEAKMKEIAAAHSCLVDTDKRRAYDRKLDREEDSSDDEKEDDFHFDIDDFFVHLFGQMFMNGRGRRSPNIFIFKR